ncbi:MAG: hypothetical protein R2824_19505 [Saprospiraceae bacterium]|nr:hypothetical protein [Lewinella sp.]
MKRIATLVLIILAVSSLPAQHLEIGMETTIGPAYTTFRGDLSQIVGFSEIELSEEDVDKAFTDANINAPRWVRDLFPGLRIDLADQEVSKQLSRSVKAARFFARYRFLGVSFTVSDPRITTPLESKKLKNQWKALRLSLSGDAEGLSEHLAVVALADAKRVEPFFDKRYELEAYLHLKKLFLPDHLLLEWGDNNTIDYELTTGLRFSADPSPVVDLGNILFVREKIDELLEGGLLASVEGVTDEIAEAIQNVVFGQFRDPRIVPSFGWLGRAEAKVNFGSGFSVVAGAELSLQKHMAVRGTKPMFSAYGFLGGRWNILSK